VTVPRGSPSARASPWCLQALHCILQASNASRPATTGSPGGGRICGDEGTLGARHCGCQGNVVGTCHGVRTGLSGIVVVVGMHVRAHW